MTTTHVCLKTYHARDLTGELRPITTKKYIVKIFKHDLLWGKMLNKARKQDIDSFSMKIQKNLEYSWSMKERYANRNHFFSSAAWPISITLRQSRFVCGNLGRCPDMTYGTEDSGIVQIEISEKLLLTESHSMGLEDLRSKTFEEYTTLHDWKKYSWRPAQIK